MLASVNIHSPVPVYKQIENHVQFAIASGRLKSGERLPTVKELADRLKINPNTVAKAYRDLEVMGLIYTRRGMGCFVRKNIEGQCRTNCSTDVVRRLHEVVQEAKAAGVTKKELTQIVNKSFTLEVDPYDEVPNEVLGLVKKAK